MNVQNVTADVLSDVLGTVNARAACSVRLTAGGRWSVAFPRPAHIKFNAVRRGGCWLIVDGSEPVRLVNGDCLMIAGSGFTLAGDVDALPIDAGEVFSESNPWASVGPGDEFAILGGSVEIDEPDGALLKGVLPPVLVINQAESGPIGWLLDQLDEEWGTGNPGAKLVCDNLLQMIFIHVLRRYISTTSDQDDWLAGLKDDRLARALHAIHAEPARDWTVRDLAKVAGQSRSAFAERFKRVVGASPLEYVARWRMRLAAIQLRGSGDRIARIASNLGYASESAFGSAFRRAHGQSPGRYRRDRRAADDI